MSTPCNSLNVQLIKVSQLSNYSSLKDADQLMIVENTGGSKFSRRSQLSNVRSYMLDTGLSGFPVGISYNSITDSNNLSFYSSGKVYSCTHGLGSVPSLVRIVLLCNSSDGLFLTNEELDLTSCYNENTKPLATVLTNTSVIKVCFSSFSNAYAYNPLATPTQYSLNKLNWQIKTYVWK